MARILDYISEIVGQLNDNIDYNEILRQEDMYVIGKYVARNPNFVYGNCSPFADTTKTYPKDGLIQGQYGINTSYWKSLKKVADQKGKQKTEYFKERILTGSGAKDPDVRKLMDRLFKHPVYEDLVDALGNLINYNVLNNTFQSIGERGSTFDKINTNLNFDFFGPYPKNYVDYNVYMTFA